METTKNEEEEKNVATEVNAVKDLMEYEHSGDVSNLSQI